MAETNKIAQKIIPEIPKVIDKEQVFVYIPTASYDSAGLSSFNREDFIVNSHGKVYFDYTIIHNWTYDQLSKKVDKVTNDNTYGIAYGVSPSNEQITYPVRSGPNERSIVYRDGSGRAKIEDPVDPKDIANKEYADTKVTEVTSPQDGRIRFYGHVNGSQVTIEGKPAISPGTLIRRDDDGRANIPEPIEDDNIANKKYVDDAVADINDEVLIIPTGTETIGVNEYSNLPHKIAIIPDTVTNIGNSAFSYCSNLSIVKLGKNITDIEEDAFLMCPVDKYKIPKSVKYIGSQAFSCEDIHDLEIDLTDFGVNEPFPMLNGEAWFSNPESEGDYKIKILVPNGRRDELMSMDYWTYGNPEIVEVITTDTLEDSKVDKVITTGGVRAYTVDTDGSQKMTDVSAISMAEGTIISRDADGRSNIGYPDTDNPDNIANVKYVKDEVKAGIEELVGSAPDALDTIYKLAEALGDDEDPNTSIVQQIAKKVDKVDVANKVYGTDTAGGQTTYPISSTADANSIILRDGNGRAKIATPDADADIANKAYADTKVAKVTTAHTATIAYTQDPDGGDTTCTLSSRGDRNTIMYRDVDGRSEIGYPAKDAHIANKQYVDTAAEYGYPPEDVLVIPNGTTDIADRAYGNTKYKRVIVPNSVTNIGKSAFIGCKNLKSITLKSVEYGSGLSSIKDATFYGCTNLESIVLPKTVHSIGREAFWQCYSLRSVTLPATLISIGAYAFFDCRSLERIVIPHGVSSISAEAFFGCDKLTEVIIPNSVTTIGDDAFGSCGINNIDLPNSLISIGNSVFDSTKLNSIVIPNSVTSIGSRVFKACTYLVDVTIGNSVTEIGFDIFTNCRNLKKIDLTTFGISKAFPMLSGTLFENYYGNDNPTEFQILVPKGRKAELEAMTNWSEYADKIVEVATTETLDSQKIDKLKNYASRGYTALYGQQVNGIETDYRLATEPAENSVMYRDSAGVSYVVTPVDAGATAVANKGYVDEAVKNTGGENKVDKLKDYATREYDAVYGQLSDGTETDVKLSNMAESNSAMYRNAYGVSHIITPDDDADNVDTLIANKGYVKSKISELLNSAPETLDTLNELATALGNDPNFATTVSTEIGKKLDKIAVSHASTVAYVQEPDGNDASRILDYSPSANTIMYRDGNGRSKIAAPYVDLDIANKSYVDNTVNKTHYGYSGDDLLIIPEGTTEIVDGAYEGTAYKCVVIPEGVTKIGNYAFDTCTNIEKVVMPNSITIIGNCTFRQCIKLADIVIPDNVTHVGADAFWNCNGITSIAFPNSVTRIDSGAFYECNLLKSIAIGNGVAYIGNDTFNMCENLTKVDLTSYGLTKAFPVLSTSAFTNTSPDLQILVPKGRKAELSAMTNWSAYADKIVEVAITETLDAQKVDKYKRPSDDTLDRVYIQTRNGNDTTLAIDYAFRAYTIPQRDSNGNIQVGSAENDNDAVNKAYLTRALTDATTGNVTADFVNKTHYGYSGDDLLIIPDGTTEIADDAYKGTGYKCVVIPEGVTSIGNHAFRDSTALTSITIPSSVTTIHIEAFSGCSSLTSITIPNGVTDIGNYAFYGCSSLKSITIPDSVTSIGNHAFDACSRLAKFDLTSYGLSKAFPTLGADVFLSTSPDLQILVPKGRKAELSAMTNWSAYADNIVEVPTVETLESGKLDKDTSPHGGFDIAYGQTSTGIDRSFTLSSEAYASSIISRDDAGRSKISDPFSDLDIANKHYVDDTIKKVHYGYYGSDLLIIPETTTLIAPNKYENATYKCIVIPDSVTRIGTNAFKNCKNLVTVTIGNGVTEIDNNAFYGCANLKTVTIGNNVNSIKNSVFEECTSLQNIAIPDNVTYIGLRAFYNCNNLKYVKLPNELLTIYDSTFEACASLLSIDIPDKVTTIGQLAFNGCVALSEVKLGKKVHTLNEYAFYSCDIKEIKIPSSVIKIDSFSFGENANLTTVDFTEFESSATGLPTIYDDSIAMNTGLKMLVPDTKRDASETMSGWSAYSKYLLGVTTVTGLENRVQALETALTNQ